MLLGGIAKLAAGVGHDNITFVAMLPHVVAHVMPAKPVLHLYGMGRLSFFSWSVLATGFNYTGHPTFAWCYLQRL